MALAQEEHSLVNLMKGSATLLLLSNILGTVFRSAFSSGEESWLATKVPSEQIDVDAFPLLSICSLGLRGFNPEKMWATSPLVLWAGSPQAVVTRVQTPLHTLGFEKEKLIFLTDVNKCFFIVNRLSVWSMLKISNYG
ncbi:hypothetical protein DSO57_1033399 [Entomophthora muscae]|uniref:Uncharacterized protein n=1 Tax=Entomophthora muscae TaxID=34485 RepID=A0ACC2S276_9FUNG|nr:hypothetical protein DSO57_1033399 [Entomophthora muscae]